jgi:hypothetical protein
MLEFSIRLVICCNGCAVGSRLCRDKPFPKYQNTYDDTPEGRSQAVEDMQKIKQYVYDYNETPTSRKRAR